MADVKLGIIGWNYPEWKGLVYPKDAKPDAFLRHYAERFPIVEAASAAYGMPKTEVVAAWAEKTPDAFEISVKVPEWILRKKPGEDADLPQALATLVAHLEPLAKAGKLGAVVAQFHPNFRHDKKAADLAAFVALLPKGPRWAVELRHDSWWREETYATLRDAGVTLVWSAPDGALRTPPVMTTDALYLRIFGDRELPEPYATKRRDGSAELRYWADRIRDEGAGAKKVDVLLSKYLEGYAPGTVDTMAQMLGVTVSGPPAKGPRQTTLGV